MVKVEKTTPAGNYVSRLTSQHALARACQANGHVKVAVDLLEHVVRAKSLAMAHGNSSRRVLENLLARL